MGKDCPRTKWAVADEVRFRWPLLPSAGVDEGKPGIQVFPDLIDVTGVTVPAAVVIPGHEKFCPGKIPDAISVAVDVAHANIPEDIKNVVRAHGLGHVSQDGLVVLRDTGEVLPRGLIA